MKKFAVYILLQLLASALNAQENPKIPAVNIEELNGKYRMAMEIELSSRPLANMVRFFDFSALNFEELPEEYFKDYILNHPKAFDSLPKELRDQLTEGLGDTKVHIELSSKQKDAIESKIIIPSKGVITDLTGSSQSSNQTSIFLGEENKTTSQGRILIPTTPEPTASTPAEIDRGFDSNAGLIKTRGQTSWSIINERWNKLPFEEIYSHLNWDYISAKKKAQIFIDETNSINLRESFV